MPQRHSRSGMDETIMKQAVLINRSPVKSSSFIAILIILITGCSHRLSDDQISLQKMDIDSVYLEEYYEWDSLEASKAVLEYTEESGDTNLYNLYRKYDYNMLWINRGSLNSNARQLIESLCASWKEGLSNASYNMDEINNLVNTLQSKRKIRPGTMKKYIRLEMLFSNAYLDYASDLLSGKVNPGALDSIWEAHPREENHVNRMEKALNEGTISQSLTGLRPDNPQYKKLASKLEDYLTIKNSGGWTMPGYFPLLTPGDSNENVISVKKYLRKTGDLVLVDKNYIRSGLFDQVLKSAVINYQQRHGIKPDGLVGKETLTEINNSIEYRIDQIRVNMERMRWLPGSFGEKYILVNLPEYKLRYYEEGSLLEEMRIVIGEVENYTPVLKDTLRYIVFNPTWNLPRSIAVKEKLPKIKADSTYLERFDYILLKGSYVSKDTVSPDSVDWSDINKENFPFYLVQKPGKYNALGRIKFLFPNHHAIYLHDTPSGHLFDAYERDFSHGCIRLERPFELASKMLKGQMTWTEMQDVLESEETTSIILDETIKVHFLYFTAWVDDQDRIHFRKDLYKFDRMTAEEL